MKINYYGVPKDIEYIKNPIVDDYKTIIEEIYKLKESLKVNASSLKKDIIKEILGHELCIELSVYDKGIMLIISQKVDNASNFHEHLCIAFMTITDSGIEYIVELVTKFSNSKIECFEINTEIYEEKKNLLGNLRTIPKEKTNFFNRKKQEKFILETIAINETYFDFLKDEQKDYIEQIELKESKLERKKREYERLKEQIISTKENLDKQVDQYKKLTTKEIYVKRDKLPFEVVFQKVGDHFEILPYFLENNRLRGIDLSSFTFENVKLTGVDLSETNARINPQIVYMKDLSFGHYEGVDFAFYSFQDVNVTGATFGPGEQYTSTGFCANFDKAINNDIPTVRK